MKNKIIEILKEAGLYSAVYRDRVANEAIEILGDKAIDSAKFDSWLKDLNFEGQNIRTYFLGCLKNAVMQDLFNPSISSAFSEAASAPQSVSEFEASWEDWKKLLNELDPNDGIPSKGVFCQDGNTNVVRAISDGDGGIVYIDGTLSERYPCFEDLDDEKKRDISNACIKLHRSAGYLERFKGLMEKIKPYETAS